MAAELLVQGSTLSIAPEDILRLTVRDIPDPVSFHPEFTRFSFVPRSIGTGDTYVEASLSMFKVIPFLESLIEFPYFRNSASLRNIDFDVVHLLGFC